MKPLHKLLSIALIVTISACSKDDDTDLSIIVNETATTSQLELEILQQVNEHRKTLNLKDLAPLNIISTVADDHTNYMIQVGKITHDNFAERCQILIEQADAKKVSEVLAYGYISAKAVVEHWLASEAHRKIIETPEFTNFGVSAKTNSEGRYYFTQILIEK